MATGSLDGRRQHYRTLIQNIDRAASASRAVAQGPAGEAEELPTQRPRALNTMSR